MDVFCARTRKRALHPQLHLECTWWAFKNWHSAFARACVRLCVCGCVSVCVCVCPCARLLLFSSNVRNGYTGGSGNSTGDPPTKKVKNPVQGLNFLKFDRWFSELVQT
jgi:hypothetical protein